MNQQSVDVSNQEQHSRDNFSDEKQPVEACFTRFVQQVWGAAIAALGFMSALDGALLIAMINPDLIDLADHGMKVMAQVVASLGS